MTSRHRPTGLPAITVSLCIACGSTTPEGVIVRDSAGVQISESSSPAWRNDDAWTVASLPRMQIGTLDGDPTYQFFRIEAAVSLPDGGIVVANGGTSELKAYDDAGQHLWTVGRQGEAPGEYRLITGLGVGPGDSFWVYDFGLRRFTVLTSGGETIRTFAVGAALSAVNAVGRLPDGSFVVKEGWSSRTHENNEFGLARQPVAIARFMEGRPRHDTIVALPGREIFLGTEGRRMVMSAPLFARNASAAMRGGTVVAGSQETFEIGFYSSQGILERIARVLDVDLSISTGDLAAMTKAILASEDESERVMLAQHLDEMDVPPSRPAYGDILTDRRGNVWLAEYVRYPAVPESWTVLDVPGRLLGVVRMPARFRLTEVGDDYVLGVWRDDSDVEYVRKYGLLKPSG